MSFISTEEISKEDLDNLPCGVLYCCSDDGKYELIKLGTIWDDIIVDELDTPCQCFSIWSFDLIYGSKWVDTLNDWGI